MTRAESILALKPYVDRVAFQYHHNEDAIQEAWLGAVLVVDGRNAVGRIHGRAQDFFRQGWNRQGGTWSKREVLTKNPVESSYWPDYWRGVACEELLEGVPLIERRLIDLHYWYGLKISELAELFGVSEGRISQLHMKALSRMREKAGIQKPAEAQKKKGIAA